MDIAETKFCNKCMEPLVNCKCDAVSASDSNELLHAEGFSMKTIVELKQLIQAKRQDIKVSIGINFKKYRKMNNYTQQEICDELGIERTTITNIEAGKQNMTMEHLLGFCEFFGITPNDMLEGV